MQGRVKKKGFKRCEQICALLHSWDKGIPAKVVLIAGMPLSREWRSPQNGFVERILTQQHCAHRLRKQAWVVNPGNEGNIPRPGWGKKDEKSKEGGRGANDRDKTCSKNWDTQKNIISSSLGISCNLENGQIERWYFDRRPQGKGSRCVWSTWIC